jgi:hypothetical protein
VTELLNAERERWEASQEIDEEEETDEEEEEGEEE